MAPALACRLFFKSPVAGAGERSAAVVELENTGAEVLEVVLANANHPFRNLDLVIESADGRRLVKQPYGLNFINGTKTRLWRLGPGERYARSVLLSSGLALGALSSEHYRVRAVYDVGGVRAVSQVVTVSRDQLLPSG